jgi:hypothetical protein
LSAQAAQQKAALDFQKAQNDTATLAAHIYNYQNTAAYQDKMGNYYNKMADTAEATKPTALEKLVKNAEALTNQDPQYRIEAARLSSKEGAEPGTPEYNAAIQRMYEIQKRHHIALGLEAPPPPVMSEPVIPDKPVNPGLFERVFGPNKAPANTIPPSNVQKALDKYKQ